MALPRTSVFRSSEETVEAVDRRRLPRMRLDVPVYCELDGEKTSARARSISGTGMLLETSRPVALGSVLHVSIGPPLTPNEPFEARMLVTRVEAMPGGDGRHRIAGKFELILDDHA